MKKIVSLALALAMVLSLAGGASAKRVLKFGHIAPVKIGPHAQALHAGNVAFAEYVKEKTGGEIQVDIFPLGQLGNERSMLEQAQFGSLDILDCTTAVLSNLVPQVGLFDLFFLFPNKEVAHKVLMDPMYNKILADLLLPMGLVHIGFGENEMRDFNSPKPVVSTDDFKGLRVRVMQSPVFLDSIRALGGNPVGMPFPEVYTALQQGVIDMQENPLVTSVAMKFVEVAKHITESSHSYTSTVKMVSRDVWETLSPKEQKIIKEAGKLATKRCWEMNYEIYPGMRKMALEDFGCTIHELTPENRAGFVKAVKPVHEKFAGIAGKIPNKEKYGKYAGMLYYDMIQDLIAKYSK